MTAEHCPPLPYEPPPSLWHLVESNAPSHELDELKNLLGESLVEQSLELHQEVELLLGIWNDYRQETLTQSARPRFPEPPAQRELLKSEIRFLVDSIHEKAAASGRDASQILSHHSSQVLDYALDDRDSGRSTSSSRASALISGRDSPLRRPSSVTSSCDSARCDTLLTDIHATVGGKLNIFELNQVTEHLRDVLQQEVNNLIDGIAILQNSLDDEVQFRSCSRTDCEPSLAELRQERKNLEAELHATDFASLLLDGHSRENSPDLASSPVIEPDRGRPQAVRLKSDLSMRSDSAAKPNSKRRSSANTVDRTRPVKAFMEEKSPVVANIRRLSLTSNDSVPVANKPAAPGVAPPTMLRMLRSATPSHVTIRTGTRPSQVVHVATPPAAVTTGGGHFPLPPTGPRPVRPCSGTRASSAQRLRSMVLDCRDGN